MDSFGWLLLEVHFFFFSENQVIIRNNNEENITGTFSILLSWKIIVWQWELLNAVILKKSLDRNIMEKQEIIHKRFQKDYKEGSIEVQLNFVVDNGVVEVSNVQIHGTFDTCLPSSPTFKLINKMGFLIAQHESLDGKAIITPIVGNNYANDIVAQILKLKIELQRQIDVWQFIFPLYNNMWENR